MTTYEQPKDWIERHLVEDPGGLLACEPSRLGTLNEELRLARQANEAQHQQLAERDKQVVMLREVIERNIERMHFAEPWSAAESDIEFSREALAATADLKDVILCHAEPTIETLSIVTNTGYVYVRAIDRKVEPNTKLFSAWEPKK